MQRFPHYLLMLFFCFLTASPALGQSLDLDKPINQDLLAASEYYSDTSGVAGFEEIGQLQNDQWQRFNREQLRLGFTKNPMWVRTHLSISGSEARKIALSFHNVIDHMQMEISAEGEPVQQFKFGRSSSPHKKAHQ